MIIWLPAATQKSDDTVFNLKSYQTLGSRHKGAPEHVGVGLRGVLVPQAQHVLHGSVHQLRAAVLQLRQGPAAREVTLGLRTYGNRDSGRPDVRALMLLLC